MGPEFLLLTENVHAGETVDTAQKRNLYRVTIGTQGVGLLIQERGYVCDTMRAWKGNGDG